MDWLGLLVNSGALDAVLTTIVTVLISLVSAFIYRYTGIKIEEKYKRDIHDALLSGARAAIVKSPSAGIDIWKQMAVKHARNSVPDAIKRLVKDRWDQLDDIAIAKVEEVILGNMAAAMQKVESKVNEQRIAPPNARPGT